MSLEQSSSIPFESNMKEVIDISSIPIESNLNEGIDITSIPIESTLQEGVADTYLNLAIFITLYGVLLYLLYNIAKRAIWTYDMAPGSQSKTKKSYPSNHDKASVIDNEYLPNEDGDGLDSLEKGNADISDDDDDDHVVEELSF